MKECVKVLWSIRPKSIAGNWSSGTACIYNIVIKPLLFKPEGKQEKSFNHVGDFFAHIFFEEYLIFVNFVFSLIMHMPT